jgi:stage II sporulation SpoAA-like protein
LDKLFQITTSWKGDILELFITGRVIKQNAKDIALDVFKINAEYKPTLMLIDCRELEGRLGLADAYGLVSEYPVEHHTTSKTAVVENAENSEIFTLQQNAATNAGYPVRYFTDETRAKNWLLR